MTDPKNMVAAYMRFLFLYKSKNYGEIVGVSIACAEITNNINQGIPFPMCMQKNMHAVNWNTNSVFKHKIVQF
jgi:hypothetical protein